MNVVSRSGIIGRTEYEMPRHCANSPRRDTGRLIPMYPHSTPSPIDPAIRIEGDVAYIPLRSGKYPGYTAMVDVGDLDQVGIYKWTVRMSKSGKVHARRGVRVGDKVRTIYLHHEIAGTPPEGYVVGHIDGDCLNNTRKNLRVGTVFENFQNLMPEPNQEDIEIEKDASCPSGGVYLIKAADRYKIGLSANPGRRVMELRTASPYPITIIHIERTPNYKDLEKRIHKLFVDYRQHGEWFDFDDRMIPIVIRTIELEATA